MANTPKKFLGPGGLAQLVVEIIELIQLAAGGEAGTCQVSFSAQNWTSDGAGGVTMTILPSKYGVTGPVMSCAVYCSTKSGLSTTAWLARETAAAINSQGNVVLSCPESKGYAGACLLRYGG